MIQLEAKMNREDVAEIDWDASHEIAPPYTTGVVHDLGNLIQMASSALNIISRNANVNASELAPVIAGAQAALGRAGGLVKRTIGAARGWRPRHELVSVSTSLQQLHDLLAVSWDGKHRVETSTEHNLFVVCDTIGLQNAILNLLTNARDAMPDGGVIKLTAKAASSGADVEVHVVDQGVGMNEQTIRRAFDPFFTTKADGLGGVGLSMVERFVRESGGRIEFKSEPGMGTAVTLVLPTPPRHSAEGHR